MSCPYCGTNFHWVKCKKCGAEICDFCGNEINWEYDENAEIPQEDNAPNEL